jgi:hypothetical protein
VLSGGLFFMSLAQGIKLQRRKFQHGFKKAASVGSNVVVFYNDLIFLNFSKPIPVPNFHIFITNWTLF